MPTTTPLLSRGDKTSLFVTIAFGAVGAIAALWFTAQRIIEVIPNRDVPVRVPFETETAPLPLGPGGASVEAAINEATITVSSVAPATHFALIAEPLIVGVAVIVGIAMLCRFCLNVMRGRAFSRGNVRIVTAGVMVVILGWYLGSLMTTMAVNGAFATLSDGDYEGITFTANWGAPLAGLALGAVGAAFQIGHRLQRDTEGLV